MCPYVWDVHASLWEAAEDGRKRGATPEVAVSIGALIRIANAIDCAIGLPIPDGAAPIRPSPPVPAYPIAPVGGGGRPVLRFLRPDDQVQQVIVRPGSRGVHLDGRRR